MLIIRVHGLAKTWGVDLWSSKGKRTHLPDLGARGRKLGGSCFKRLSDCSWRAQCTGGNHQRREFFLRLGDLMMIATAFVYQGVQRGAWGAMADGSGPVAVMAGPAQNEVAAAPDLGDAIKFEPGWTCLCGQHSTVNVEARTWANINKHGGVGRIVKYNGDATYAVRYLLGGGEKSVDMCYITCNGEGGGKREAKVRELYDPVAGVRRPSRHSFATPVTTDDTAPPRKSQPLMPVKDSRKNAVPAPHPEEEAPVAKKAKVAAPKAKRPLQTDEENQEPDRQAQQPAPVAVSKRTPKPGKPPPPPVVVVRPKVVKPVPEVVHKSQCVPSPPRPSQPCQMEVVVTDEDDDSEPEMSQPQEPGLLSSISDERRKEFKVCMSEAFGHSDAITVDELRAACGGFSKEELDVLIGMVEKEGRIFIDGDRVYWC